MMQRRLRELIDDREHAHALATNGLNTVLRRHTCAHRVDQLLAIYQELARSPKPAAYLAAGAGA
jgi:spore maturation protein CgeB